MRRLARSGPIRLLPTLLLGAGLLCGGAASARPGHVARSAAKAPTPPPPVDLPAAFTPGDAERVLAPPSGSRSLGATSAGRLLAGRAIKPGRRAGWAFMPHIPARQTTWGTDRMQRLLDHLGARLHGCRKGAELRVGNISLRHGGPSPWHRSHQAGRDVDLAPMLVDRDGKAAPTDDFVRLDRRGVARDGSGRRLDAHCTLRLVIALTEPDAPPVQWAFFARWLERLLLQQAERERLPADVLARVEEVLRQPSDSAPHDDHLHVRMFCSEPERRHGCLDREPWRDWAPRDDEGFARHVDAVGRIAARAGAIGKRRRATGLLASLRSPLAAPALGARLLDRDAAIRMTAFAGLVALGDEAAVGELLAAFRRTEDDALAVRLFEAAKRLRGIAAVALAQALLVDPDHTVQPLVQKRVGDRLAVLAIGLLGEHGDRQAVPPLIDALRKRARAVREAAHRALRRLTNQNIRADVGTDAGAATAAEKWQAFWQRAKGWSLAAWLASGFRDHGVRVRQKQALSRADAPRLIAAMRHRDPDVRANAERALELLAGRPVRGRTTAARARAWRRWYRATSR